MKNHSVSRKWSSAWLRWVLVLPAAVAGYFTAAFVLGVVFGSISRSWDPAYADFPNPTWKLVLLRGLLEPAAFICAGVATAPSRRFTVSIVLSVLLGGFIIFAFLRATQQRGFDWFCALSNFIGLVALVTLCVLLYRDHSKKRSSVL